MSESKIQVYFDKKVNNLLFKKFHMFNSGLVPISRYEENIDALKRIQPDSIRIDLFLGDREKEMGNVVDGAIDNITYNFEKLDYLASLLLNHNILPYWSWCYIPLPLQPKNTDFRTGPTDLVKYGEVLCHLAKHYKEKGIYLGYQEVYNEPDCYDNFFKGTFNDYLKMYEYGVQGLKKGDPNAVVGGPAEAFVEKEEVVKHNLDSFVKLVLDKNLPLDFFSYHSYGYKNKEYVVRTQYIESLLDQKEKFLTTELHMNELNVIPPPWEYGKTCLTSPELVPIIWQCIVDLLEYQDLTIVHWAQLLNSGVDELSLVGLDGIYYPAFYVFEIYNRMPVERCEVVQSGNIRCLASCNDFRYSAVLEFWNKKRKSKSAVK